ncbi:MAG: DEAD/DEAH box helicase [Methanobacteriota archaeon]|nr:MAG: DEAD/DEAH box helicase [Euryarchaeota archaeon]
MKSFNPITFSQKVLEQYLRYQLTAFRFADPDLQKQFRTLISFNDLSKSPLIKGPFISLERKFQTGMQVSQLVDEGLLHPGLKNLIQFTLHKHQENAIRSIVSDQHTIITTGTGSGKTESFLIPIISHCLKMRDAGKSGVQAILIYPMNALANDQLERISKLLVGTGVTFGVYTGDTRDQEEAVERVQTREEYKVALKRKKRVYPEEQRVSRQEIRNDPPMILITNVFQLELLLTRKSDINLFERAPLKYVVIDEAHTYGGIFGAEASVLFRRIIARSATFHADADEVVCIATSATLGEESETKEFMFRLTGSPPERTRVIGPSYDQQVWQIRSALLIKPRKITNPEDVYRNFLEKLYDSNLSEEDAIFEAVRYAMEHVAPNLELDPSANWRESLFEYLPKLKFIRSIAQNLERPRNLTYVLDEVSRDLGFSKDEGLVHSLLLYLALASIAQKDGDPLFRAKLHYFVSGIRELRGELVSSGLGTKVILHMKDNPTGEKRYFPVLICRNCNQHYLEQRYTMIEGKKTGSITERGLPSSDGSCYYYEAKKEEDGVRILFSNNLNGIEDEDSNRHFETLFACEQCGTLHDKHVKHCASGGCGHDKLVKVFALVQKGEKINRCGTCERSTKGRYEPMAKVQGIQVANNYILAQEILFNLPEDSQRLLMFADNRQEAAFQVAWMTDKAKVYRLRHLMFEVLRKETKDGSIPVSIGDLVQGLTKILYEDRDLAMNLFPDAFGETAGESFSKNFKSTLETILVYRILIEITNRYSNRENLEGMGVINIEYEDLNPENEHIKELSRIYSIDEETLTEIIRNMLHLTRKNRVFSYGKTHNIFSRFWKEGDQEVLSGYLPYYVVEHSPFLLQFEKGDGGKKRIKNFYSRTHETSYTSLVRKSGINIKSLESFFKDIWQFLTEKTNLLVPVEVKIKRGAETWATGYQLNGKKVGIKVVPKSQRRMYQCQICGLLHPNPSPVCIGWRCEGRLVKIPLPDDDYNLSTLDSDFVLLLPKEHTAQVPGELRRQFEEEFKKPKGSTNVLVASPTMELGVDIGGLDVVLMRNVPPTPSNYWQRAGRVGRREGIGVIFNYCTNNAHDDYFFNNPSRMLNGKTLTPVFNLKNRTMVRKHIHATVLAQVIRNNRMDIYNKILPPFVKSFLVGENGSYITVPSNETIIKELRDFISANESSIVEEIRKIFSIRWPREAKGVADPKFHKSVLKEFPESLLGVIKNLQSRFIWAEKNYRDLSNLRRDLDREEKNLLEIYRRIYTKMLSKNFDNYTYNFYQNQGLLPAYSANTEGVIAQSPPPSRSIVPEFAFSRIAPIALREFSPGYALYVLGAKFSTSLIELSKIGEVGIDIRHFTILGEMVIESNEDWVGYSNPEENSYSIGAIPLSNVILRYVGRVDSDAEEFRRVLPIKLNGKPQQFNGEGKRYEIGDKILEHISDQSILLLNSGVEKDSTLLQYPICPNCGAVRSVFTKEQHLEKFQKFHLEKCGSRSFRFGIYYESEFECILLKGFDTKDEYVNIFEGILIGISNSLESNREDFDYFVFSTPEEQLNGILFDPMKGGSGILEQLIEKWINVIDSAIEKLMDCGNACETSCYACMKTYWNQPIHDLLNRHLAIDLLNSLKLRPKFQHVIPENYKPSLISKSSTPPEMIFENYLKLHRLFGYTTQEKVDLGDINMPYTIPDFTFKEEKIAIYIDGNTFHTPSNKKDRIIDILLKKNGWDVFRVYNSDLEDKEFIEIIIEQIAEKIEEMRKRG